jgi:hypothetical protein
MINNERSLISVEFSESMVSNKGREIYEALIAGEGIESIRERFGLSIGSMHGYVDRAVKYGIITDTRKRRKSRTIVAVSMMKDSEGQTYEMRGGAEVLALGFEYSKAWAWAKKKIEKDGYLWYFKGEL